MRPVLAVSAVVTVASLLAVCPYARAFGPDPEPAKITHLRNEIIKLDASLITLMSEAENSLSDDVEALRAGLVAAQIETVDTFAAYHEAKSLIHDLDVLRHDAIADLAVPSGYKPPEVVSESLASTTSVPNLAINRPEEVLKSTYQDLADAMRLMVSEINAKAAAIEKNLEVLATKEDTNIREMFHVQVMVNQLSELSEASTSILSTYNSAIASMARNVRQLPRR